MESCQQSKPLQSKNPVQVKIHQLPSATNLPFVLLKTLKPFQDPELCLMVLAIQKDWRLRGYLQYPRQ